MKRNIILQTPLNRGKGLSQSEFAISNIQVRKGGFIVRTEQGNQIIFRKRKMFKDVIEALEDMIKARLEGTAEDEALDIDPPVIPIVPEVTP